MNSWVRQEWDYLILIPKCRWVVIYLEEALVDIEDNPPPPDIPDVSRAIRDHHMPPIESGMIGAQRMRGNGYNNYGSAYDPQIGPKPHKMAHARPINLGPGSQPPALPRII
jgi:hypothetical protein